MNTQEAILSLLEKQPTVCAEDLSLVLLKTRANLQYHLKRMEQAGLIERIPAAIHGQGRPRHAYALSARSRAHYFLGLTEALLDALFPAGLPPEKTQETAAEIARIFAKTFSLSPQKTFTRQLSQLVKELSAQGYQARWEARAVGPLVVFHNCPYSDLLLAHPELCQIDAALIRFILGKDCTQQSKIQYPQVSSCKFAIASQS